MNTEVGILLWSIALVVLVYIVHTHRAEHHDRQGSDTDTVSTQPTHIESAKNLVAEQFFTECAARKVAIKQRQQASTSHHRQKMPITKESHLPRGYIQFNNLVLESGYNTPYTEIDSVIVSQYGIFCIEQKDMRGVIVGNRTAKVWTQCLPGHTRYTIQNPRHQNYKHIKALEKLLAAHLNAPIHNYVYFPLADIVRTNDNLTFCNRHAVRAAIWRYTIPIYSPSEVQIIAKLLAYESTHTELRLPHHINTLQHYHA